MTDFKIPVKEYKPKHEINTYKETKETKSKSDYKDFIEKRLVRMGTSKIT